MSDQENAEVVVSDYMKKRRNDLLRRISIARKINNPKVREPIIGRLQTQYEALLPKPPVEKRAAVLSDAVDESLSE